MSGGSGNLPSAPRAPSQLLKPTHSRLSPSERPKHPILLDLGANEPELEEDLIKRRIARQKNADKRFNSPFGFHEPKFKKVSFFQRYPKFTHRVFVGTALLLFFRWVGENLSKELSFYLRMISSNELLYFVSKPIYDATLREPSSYEIERAEFLKKRMQATGWWDNPFAFWRTSKVSEEDWETINCDIFVVKEILERCWIIQLYSENSWGHGKCSQGQDQAGQLSPAPGLLCPWGCLLWQVCRRTPGRGFQAPVPAPVDGLHQLC